MFFRNAVTCSRNASFAFRFAAIDRALQRVARRRKQSLPPLARQFCVMAIAESCVAWRISAEWALPTPSITRGSTSARWGVTLLREGDANQRGGSPEPGFVAGQYLRRDAALGAGFRLGYRPVAKIGQSIIERAVVPAVEGRPTRRLQMSGLR